MSCSVSTLSTLLLPSMLLLPLPLLFFADGVTLSAGFRDPRLPPEDWGTLSDAPDSNIDGDAASSATGRSTVVQHVWMGCLIPLARRHWLPVALLGGLAAAVHNPAALPSALWRPEGRSWQVVQLYPGLASVEEHNTVSRSWSQLAGRETVGLAADSHAGLPDFRFCVWSPGDRVCFHVSGRSPPVELKGTAYGSSGLSPAQCLCSLGPHACGPLHSPGGDCL